MVITLYFLDIEIDGHSLFQSRFHINGNQYVYNTNTIYIFKIHDSMSSHFLL